MLRGYPGSSRANATAVGAQCGRARPRRGYLRTMATVSRFVAASPSQVFRVLADAWTYAGWVVGASTIRAVDAGWPQPGTRLHHAVGAWPLLVVDQTEVVAVEPDRRLELQAHGWPLGEARVLFELEPEDAGTRVVMHERARRGPALLMRNPLGERLIALRNTESLARLAAMVERHS